MDIILIFARTRDVGLCRPCLHEKKTDMEQFGKILIVDDNEDVLFALNLLLEPYAEKIKVAVTPDRIEHFMTTFRPDIILLDMNFSRDAISGQEGFDSLKQILSIDPQAVVIFMTAYADTDKAVRAIKAGATDFIPKPWEKEKLLATLSSGMKLRRSRTEINLLKEQVEVLSNATAGGSEEVIIGDSLVMQQVFSTVEKLRDTDANILILGENGTGKDVIARQLSAAIYPCHSVKFPLSSVFGTSIMRWLLEPRNRREISYSACTKRPSTSTSSRDSSSGVTSQQE